MTITGSGYFCSYFGHVAGNSKGSRERFPRRWRNADMHQRFLCFSDSQYSQQCIASSFQVLYFLATFLSAGGTGRFVPSDNHAWVRCVCRRRLPHSNFPHGRAGQAHRKGIGLSGFHIGDTEVECPPTVLSDGHLQAVSKLPYYSYLGRIRFDHFKLNLIRN